MLATFDHRQIDRGRASHLNVHVSIPFCLLSSFPDRFSGAAELSGKILQFWEAIPHRKHRLGVIDVEPWGESECRYCGCVHVDEADGRMPRHYVTTAFRAVLPLAKGG